jgi:uncharacterized membrane protein
MRKRQFVQLTKSETAFDHDIFWCGVTYGTSWDESKPTCVAAQSKACGIAGRGWVMYLGHDEPRAIEQRRIDLDVGRYVYAPLPEAAPRDLRSCFRRHQGVRARRGRTFGWIWVCLMVSVAVSSFWIHQIRLLGPWSPIHLLSIFTLVILPLGVWMAHRHRVADHRRIMISIFSGALVIAGLFTLLPGRIMHTVVFGQ